MSLREFILSKLKEAREKSKQQVTNGVVKEVYIVDAVEYPNSTTFGIVMNTNGKFTRITATLRQVPDTVFDLLAQGKLVKAKVKVTPHTGAVQEIVEVNEASEEEIMKLVKEIGIVGRIERRGNIIIIVTPDGVRYAVKKGQFPSINANRLETEINSLVGDFDKYAIAVIPVSVNPYMGNVQIADKSIRFFYYKLEKIEEEETPPEEKPVEEVVSAETKPVEEVSEGEIKELKVKEEEVGDEEIELEVKKRE